ncbi:hypothetical protein JAAARDRAFT_194945 [Jaapia argillacea MUCL 33604]|uniref:Uncharacterized protein n=1 Tax=Jaapia argillacea MUCL 33604 TaxID=933084 RepID=A0A067PR45_9AGAM|nr:hypothetical protein JAAARDRAFT_194945 [Jaapia argillacea MUCL 33604]
MKEKLPNLQPPSTSCPQNLQNDHNYLMIELGDICLIITKCHHTGTRSTAGLFQEPGYIRSLLSPTGDSLVLSSHFSPLPAVSWRSLTVCLCAKAKIITSLISSIAVSPSGLNVDASGTSDNVPPPGRTGKGVKNHTALRLFSFFLLSRRSSRISDPSIWIIKHYNCIPPEHKERVHIPSTPLRHILIPAHPASSALSFTFVPLTPRHLVTPPSSMTQAMDYRPLCL